MRTIGISGQLQNGKDTLCDILLPMLEKLDVGPWKKMALADSLKDTVCRIFGVTRSFLEEWKNKSELPKGWQMTAREALILFGNTARQVEPEVWVNKIVNQSCNKVVPDVRFTNEVDAIRKKGIVIRIVRPGFENNMSDRSESEFTKFDKKCLFSEADGKVLDKSVPFDLFVLNNGTIADLAVKAKTIVLPFLEKELKFFI